jgi:trimethyllysine dioxygenase
VFVKDTPYDNPEATKQLLERIGPIRVTHYGGFYDFVPDLAMADTAYTNLALPAHTDTTYFTDPAGLQAFHLLSHQPSPNSPPEQGVSGGKSLLVDGLRAARILRDTDRVAYETLIETQLPWHASGNKGITISPDRMYPVLERAPGFEKGNSSEIHRIRWNNDDRGILPFVSRDPRCPWYDAARKWDGILRDPKSEYWFQLEPGTVLSMLSIYSASLSHTP